jgi:hypothetical protein
MKGGNYFRTLGFAVDWIAALPSVVRDDVREFYSTRFTNFVQAKGDYPTLCKDPLTRVQVSFLWADHFFGPYFFVKLLCSEQV